MLINNLVLYNKKHLYRINHPADPLYYFFDYDERPYKLNMQFQHFHSFYEIMIPLESCAGHLIEGKYYHLKMHDLILLRPNMLHKTDYPKGSPSKRIIINFRFPLDLFGLDDTLAKLLSLFDEKVPIFRFDAYGTQILLGKLNEIYQYSDSSTLQCQNLLIHNKFLEFLAEILERKEANLYHQDESSPSITDKIYNITSYIHRHYPDDLSLELISQKFYISSYYLSHTFKTVTGFTLTTYIQMTRIRNAQLLLISTNDKITTISERCGFTSFSQFNRVFHKFCQTSPSAYRTTHNMNGIETFEPHR